MVDILGCIISVRIIIYHSFIKSYQYLMPEQLQPDAQLVLTNDLIAQIKL